MKAIEIDLYLGWSWIPAGTMRAHPVVIEEGRWSLFACALL